MNLIVNAVEPLRSDAIKHARLTAIQTLNTINTMLVEGDWDVESLAPYPQGKIELSEYHKTLGTFILSRKLLKLKDAPVEETQSFILKFISDAEQNAEHQYNVFVKQLQVKIGEYIDIDFHGSHISSKSVFEVKTPQEKTVYWTNEMKSFLSKNGDHICDFVIKKSKSKLN